MKSLMIQGTSSHAGKSIFVAALLRILRNRGISCAPFKPQNMALNSFVTLDGYEIGRAQAMQAEAAKVQPSFHMNPILLKPTTDSKAQVIVYGKPWKNLSAIEYQNIKGNLKSFVQNSYETLKSNFDVVIVEGAGSPAEINLRKNDLANMGFATMYNIPVLIVGDIDRGGVYASFYGTYCLLKPKERKLVKGFVINKFRGDKSLLTPANEFIEKKTKQIVVGVIPYFTDIQISDEDGVTLQEPKIKHYLQDNQDKIKVRVVKLPRISNFTDFEPLFLEEDVDISYITSPLQANDADLIIIPGSKNTIEDLLFLKEKGFETFLKAFLEKGGFVVGICGGYQMLGKVVKDPYGVESKIKEVAGLGIINSETVLTQSKCLKQVSFDTIDGSIKGLSGYEIHMGMTEVADGNPLFFVKDDNGKSHLEGCVTCDGRAFGTYIHGLFENDKFRLDLLNRIRTAKKIKPKKQTFSYFSYKEEAFNKLATHFERSLNLDYIFSLLGV